MSSVDYREKLRAMAQEERERMNDFILSEARRKEQKDLEPEPVVAEPEPMPETTPAQVVVEPVETLEPEPKPELKPEPVVGEVDKKKSFNFLADGDVREWLLYKRECGYNTSSLIKRVLREYMAHDMEWLSHIGKGVP